MPYASVGLLNINIVININTTSHKISSLLTFVRKIKIKTNLKVTGFNYQYSQQQEPKKQVERKS